ncbi:MAG: 4'-phosphopantetheinyl transferase superfamily protein [Clostridia bacterium]|nr:4'-phosphopantetheinyl transferase superfamily protein [Clostridia bacterium]
MALKYYVLDNVLDREQRHAMVTQKAKEHFGNPDVEVVYGSRGKPSVKGIDKKYVSVTTTGAVMVVVFSDKPVGIDGEYLGRFNDNSNHDYLAIAERFFTEEEAEYVRANDSDAVAFAKVWVRKEAYSKYTGKGLADFSNFSVTDGERFNSKVNGVPVKKYNVTFPGSADYLFALAGTE